MNVAIVEKRLAKKSMNNLMATVKIAETIYLMKSFSDCVDINCWHAPTAYDIYSPPIASDSFCAWLL